MMRKASLLIMIIGLIIMLAAILAVLAASLAGVRESEHPGFFEPLSHFFYGGAFVVALGMLLWIVNQVRIMRHS